LGLFHDALIASESCRGNTSTLVSPFENKTPIPTIKHQQMTAAIFDPGRAASFVFDAHKNGAEYANLPDEIAPRTITEAYAAQEALAALLKPSQGQIAGLKIATTTKVMQALMGIDHPCGGMIFERRVHRSPAHLSRADYTNLVIECELAVRLGKDLAASSSSYTRENIQAAVAEVMPAFELIDDRRAHYKSVKAMSLIADNCWNGGVVLGNPMPPSNRFTGIPGTLEINGKEAHHGQTDDPLGALAWVANLAVERGRPLQKGMIVITGSAIPTLPIAAGDTFVFRLEGLGSVTLAVR
jgi:2-keto-4-pentenoate hydratase